MSAFIRSFRLSRPLVALLLMLAGALMFAVGQPAAQQEPARHAVVLTLDGAVSPATADYLIRGIDSAAEQGATLVVIRMDTPGGLVTSTRDIVNAILASPVPVAVHVAPSGARAASAGTYITYAAHVAAMAPATTIGAATPVAMGGGSPFGNDDQDDGDTEPGNGENDTETELRVPTLQGSATDAKAINDAVAWIRALAELRGRNADWAERAVREAATLTASAAAQEGVIDFVARNTEDVLTAAHGMVVDMDGDALVLDTEGLSLTTLQPDWRTQFLSVITNPNVAMLLMVVGFYGILFELYNPGALFPGTIGGISLLTGMVALSILPFNWAGLALIGLGLALVIAEIFSPSFGILGIGGTAAIVLGGVLLFDSDVPGLEMSWPALAAVAAASLAFSLVIARLAAQSHKRKVSTGAEEMIDLKAQVQDWAGARGHVFVHGERWQARIETGPQPVPGQTVTVRAIEGLTLVVTPLPGGGTSIETQP
ncbi:MAG: NfeD family protein [Pararhodobacter sp.]